MVTEHDLKSLIKVQISSTKLHQWIKVYFQRIVPELSHTRPLVPSISQSTVESFLVGKGRHPLKSHFLVCCCCFLPGTWGVVDVLAKKRNGFFLLSLQWPTLNHKTLKWKIQVHTMTITYTDGWDVGPVIRSTASCYQTWSWSVFIISPCQYYRQF